MSESNYNLCLFYKCKPFDLVKPQIDDTLILANNIFVIIKDETIKTVKFITKKQVCFLLQTPIKFNNTGI